MNKLNGIILTLGLWLVLCGTATATQLYVNDSGWWQEGGAFNTSSTPIQAAVDAAREGDSIYVWNGSYNENVDVNKTRLTLQGEGADVVTVTAVDTGDNVFEVTANYVNISGFAVRGATDRYMAGVYLDNADYCNISGNDVYGNSYGIFLSSSSNNTLTNNTANSNNCYGISLGYSSNNTLTSNTASSNNNYGITLSSSSSNTLTSNTVNSNNWGAGIYLSSSSNNTLTNNTANFNNWNGISLEYLSNYNKLTSNTANSNNDYGIWLTSSSSNTLTSNTANSNNYHGIYLDNADDNDITCNLVQGNGHGFYLTSGNTGNNVSYNNIIENGNYNATSGGWEWQFYTDQYQPVEAKHNYWGTGMNGSTIDASIHDDEEGWGEVVFYPFETEPVPCAPIPEESHTFTTTDAVIALQIAAGSRPHDARLDVSGDGSVTSLDALMILQAVAGTREVPIGGCEDLDQNVLRRYDFDNNGLIDSNEMEAAKIGYESNYEKQSDYEQILYAYEHNCPVEV